MGESTARSSEPQPAPEPAKKDAPFPVIDRVETRLAYPHATIARDPPESTGAEASIRFQAHLLDTIEQAVIATNLDGIVIYWNQFAQKLYGWRSQDVIGRQIVDLIAPQIMTEQALEIMSNLSQGNSFVVRKPVSVRIAGKLATVPASTSYTDLTMTLRRGRWRADTAATLTFPAGAVVPHASSAAPVLNTDWSRPLSGAGGRHHPLYRTYSLILAL